MKRIDQGVRVVVVSSSEEVERVEETQTQQSNLVLREEEESINPVSLLSYQGAYRELVPLALPSIVTTFMIFLYGGITFAITGRLLGTNAIPAISVAWFFKSIVAFYPLQGLAFAVDTVCAQEFGRDPSSTKQGEVTQRSMCIATVLLIPISYALQHTEPLLRQWYEPDVARDAALWVAQMPWFLVPSLYAANIAKFLCNQYKPHLPSIALTATVVSIVPAQYFCITQFGYLGSAYGIAASAWVQLAVISLLTFFDAEARQRWGPWSWGQIIQREDVALYFRLGLTSVVFVVAESAAFDVTALLAALLTKDDAAAWTIMLSVFLTVDCVCTGFSIATCAAVGSALGANKPQKALTLTKAAVMLTGALALVNGTLLYIFHRQVYGIYTNDPVVLDRCSQVAWLIIPLHFCDSVQFVFQGVFSGAGKNHLGAGALLVALWGVGVGTIWGLLKAGYGLVAVPLGLTTGLALCAPLLAGLCFFYFDWAAIAKDAAHQQQQEGVELDHCNSGHPESPSDQTALLATRSHEPAATGQGYGTTGN